MSKKAQNKIKFCAYVKLGGGLDAVRLEFYVDCDGDETSLTWDEVFDGAMTAAEERFPEEDFPNMTVEKMMICTSDGEFLVLAEDCDKTKLTKEMGSKFLILPYAVYELTDEFRKYMELSEAGLVDFEFDAEKMHKLLNITSKN